MDCHKVTFYIFFLNYGFFIFGRFLLQKDTIFLKAETREGERAWIIQRAGGWEGCREGAGEAGTCGRVWGEETTGEGATTRKTSKTAIHAEGIWWVHMWDELTFPGLESGDSFLCIHVKKKLNFFASVGSPWLSTSPDSFKLYTNLSVPSYMKTFEFLEIWWKILKR